MTALDRVADQTPDLVVDLATVGSALLDWQDPHAPEVHLRPLLTELGATTLRGLYVADSSYDDPATYAAWPTAVQPAADRFLNSTGVSA